jgi:vacuolar-type H+-ATPase subunit B/Vma2
MTSLAELRYTDVAEVRGPLLVVRGTAGVGWDELALVRLDTGAARHGLVLEVDHDLAVVQVLEGTGGIDPAATSIAFSGTPLRIPVGPGWLGRACNGRGEPVDGGPPVFGATTAPVGGVPLNPVLREPPAEPVLTGVGCRTWSSSPRSRRRRRLARSRSASCSPRWGSPTPRPPGSATRWRSAPRPVSSRCSSTSPTTP